MSNNVIPQVSGNNNIVKLADAQGNPEYFIRMFKQGHEVLIPSCALRDDNMYRQSLVSDDTWYAGNTQSGTYSEDRTLELLSLRGTVNSRFLFFTDHNRQVTFTAIPCKHGSDYGLYDIVAGKFYTHPDLTGD